MWERKRERWWGGSALCFRIIVGCGDCRSGTQTFSLHFYFPFCLSGTFRLNFDIECQWMMVWNFVFSERQCWMPFYWCFCRNNLQMKGFSFLEFVKFNFKGEWKQCLEMQCFAFVFPLKNLYQNVNVIVSL